MPRHDKYNPPNCPYCQRQAILKSGDKLYGQRFSHLAGRMFWVCEPCRASVGTHPHSKDHVPLGVLANEALRAKRREAHALFDPMWERRWAKHGGTKAEHRLAAYKWLAKQMGLEVRDCHIGHFDEGQCQRVISLCTPFKPKPRRRYSDD